MRYIRHMSVVEVSEWAIAGVRAAHRRHFVCLRGLRDRLVAPLALGWPDRRCRPDRRAALGAVHQRPDPGHHAAGVPTAREVPVQRAGARGPFPRRLAGRWTSQYQRFEAGDRDLVVHLHDPKGLAVALHYRVLPELDAILRWVVLTSSVPGIVLESFASAQLHVPFRDLTLRNVSGRWGAEQQELVRTVTGKIVLESRRGVSNHHHNPYAVLSREAGEDAGRVWAAALAFSGNTKVVVEQTQYGQTLLQLGVNDFDLEVPLEPGVPVTTPQVVAVHTDEGLGGVSRRLHAYGESLMRPGVRPVLYNSWEATNFAVTAEGQIDLARAAAGLGAELFVIDDGWFGRRNPNETGGITDGLGDWWVDPQKFPDGLTPVIDEVRRLGMAFGIWVEPEMVNPDSDLFAAHPEWVYAEPGRAIDSARGQYVLNLTLPAVQQFIVEMLDGLLTDNDIAYVKWDANRPMSQVGPARDVWFRHIEALYAIVREVKRRHPRGTRRGMRLRGRPDRLRCAGRVRRLLDQRQHRCPGPPRDTARLLAWSIHHARCGHGSPTCRTSCRNARFLCSSASTAPCWAAWGSGAT